MRIAIAGAGTAGLAAAIFFRRQGHAVDVFEAVPSSEPVGAGLLIQPTGQAVLDELGLLEPLNAQGAKIESLQGFRFGLRVMDLHYPALDARIQGLGLHRANLHQALLNAAMKSGAEIHFGHPVDAYTQSAASVNLMAGGQVQADLLVIASGSRSLLRGSLPIPQSVRPYPWGACWCICESETWNFPEVLAQRYGEPWQLVGVLPTGLHPKSGRPCYSIFFSIRRSQFPRWRLEGRRLLEAGLKKFWPECRDLLAASPAEHCTVAEYSDVRMSRYHEGRVVVLGDCAHSMSPQLGQGANLALMDAWILSRCLGAEPQPSQALALYSKLRREHLSFYQNASRLMTPLYQGSLPLGLLRDAGTALGRRIPFIYRELLLMLGGWKDGIFSSKSSLQDFGPEAKNS